MCEELSFTKIIREPKNIHEDADIEIMNENYHALESIIDKFVFSEYPKHPELFSVLFSDTDFVKALFYHFKRNNIKEPDKVIFTEYSAEDKERLIEMGVIKNKNKDPKALLVLHTFNGNTCFINLFTNI